MKNRKIRIKWNIFFWLLGFTAIILALLWGCMTLFLNDIYTAAKLSRARTAMEKLTEAVSAEDDETADLVAEIGDYYDVSLLVLDENLQRLYSSSINPGDELNKLSAERLELLRGLAERNGGSYSEQDVKKGPSEQMLALRDRSIQTEQPMSEGDRKDAPHDGRFEAERITSVRLTLSGDGAERTLYLFSTLTPVSETVYTLRVLLSYISAVMLALALLLALAISRRLAGPIVKMSDSAARLALGDYGVEFNCGSGYREIDELGSTLNYAADQLSRVDRLRSEVLANISHDLRTPLTLITGYGEMMRDLPGENTPENADIIIGEARRLSQLVDDALDISRLKSGVESLAPASFSITGEIRGILARYRKLTEQRGYTVAFEGGEQDVSVVADEVKIGQVIYNLISNALNYTGPDNRITVRQLVERGGSVRIEVADTGKGIDERELPHIFDRYYKNSSLKRKTAPMGTGLGLAIVKAILDLHKAEYGVVTGKGQGSVFWFRLPIERVD